MRHTTAITAAVLLAASLLLTGCSTASKDTAGAKPSPSPSKTQPVYDEYDCRALLERNYDADATRDAHDDPECEALTRDEYLDVVKTVLAGRKDEILEDAEQHVTWDEAWDGTDADQQELVCGRLTTDGAEVVGKEMAESSGDDEAEQIEMAEYLLDEKC